MPEKFNKGDVSEGILAAAIAARFISKTKQITTADVLKVIGQLKPGKSAAKGFSSITTFPSPNKKATILDTVVCSVNLAEVNMKAFLSKAIYKDKDINLLVSAAISYANSPYVQEWADLLYNNNQKNKIDVRSEGLLDQTGTKVDLRVVVDGTQCGVGVSLKAGDVKQFGQVGGASMRSMTEFFGPLGVKYNSAHEKKFDGFIEKKNPVAALTLAYMEAHTQINTIIKKDAAQFRKNLSAFMTYHATRNEPDVVLVQLNKGNATVYMFESVAAKLKGVPIQVQYQLASTDVIAGKKIPQLLIYGGGSTNSKNLLIQLRVKLEGNRVDSKGKKLGLTVRNYVEKGALTTTLLANH